MDLTIPSKPELTFISGSDEKMHEIMLSLGSDSPVNLVRKKMDVPEYQGTIHEIAVLKAERAAEMEPSIAMIIVEDTSLCFDALGGLPGPYIKPFFTALGNEGLPKLLVGFGDNKKAQGVSTIGFIIPGEKAEVFQGIVHGTIVDPPRGPEQYGWDNIFVPDGYDQTLAELGMDLKTEISHRALATKKLKSFLKTKFNK